MMNGTELNNISLGLVALFCSFPTSWFFSFPPWTAARSFFYRGLCVYVYVCSHTNHATARGAPPPKTNVCFLFLVWSFRKPLHALSGTSVSKFDPTSTKPECGEGGGGLSKSCGVRAQMCVCVWIMAPKTTHTPPACLNCAPRRLRARAPPCPSSSKHSSRVSLLHSPFIYSRQRRQRQLGRTNPTTPPARSFAPHTQNCAF